MLSTFLTLSLNTIYNFTSGLVKCVCWIVILFRNALYSVQMYTLDKHCYPKGNYLKLLTAINYDKWWLVICYSWLLNDDSIPPRSLILNFKQFYWHCFGWIVIFHIIQDRSEIWFLEFGFLTFNYRWDLIAFIKYLAIKWWYKIRQAYAWF